jgi:hypothetical protein
MDLVLTAEISQLMNPELNCQLPSSQLTNLELRCQLLGSYLMIWN